MSARGTVPAIAPRNLLRDTMGQTMGQSPNSRQSRCVAVSCSLFPVPYSLFPVPSSQFPVPSSLFDPVPQPSPPNVGDERQDPIARIGIAVAGLRVTRARTI